MRTEAAGVTWEALESRVAFQLLGETGSRPCVCLRRGAGLPPPGCVALRVAQLHLLAG